MDQSPKTTIQNEFDELVRKNVETISRIEQTAHEARSQRDIIVDAVASFCGSLMFIWVHLIYIGGWLLLNGVILPPRDRFDPAPFGTLNLMVSVEAIFLATFILISQNRQQRLADRRNHLDLQINLLAEQESSQMLRMMQLTMEHLGIKTETSRVEALQQATDPGHMFEQIEQSLDADSGDKPE